MHPSNLKLLKIGRGGGLVDRVADSGPYDPCSIPLGEKKENKRKKRLGLAHFEKKCWLESQLILILIVPILNYIVGPWWCQII